MRYKHKTIITAVLAALFTIEGVNLGVGGLLSGYGFMYFVGTMVIPFLLWLGTIYFYQEHKKEKQ